MSNEWFDVVDLTGRVVGQALRQVCHQNSGLIHRAVHVLVFDRVGRIFLQKRSCRKDVQPGKWDTSVGGHLIPGESPREGAEREMAEELGIKGANLRPAYEYVWRSDIETELISAFAVIHDGPFNLDPVEISEGRFWTFDEIDEQLESGIFTPQFQTEFLRIRTWRQSGDSHAMLNAG